MVESPSFDIEEFELPEWLGTATTILPEQTNLLEIECFAIEPAKCVAMTVRHRFHGKVHYGSTIFLLFDECSWMLQLEIEEDANLGEREGAVARHILDGNLSVPTVDFNPYERRWDGMVPIEHDPLTRLRLLVTSLCDSIQLVDRVALLTPFSKEDDDEE